MAWNEPGKSGQEDPWGNRRKTGGNRPQGNPQEDLEQALNKLKGLFGGSNGGGSSSGGSKLVMTVVGVLGVIWLLTGFYIIDAAERGVVLVLGKYQEEVGAGLHWRLPTPIGSVHVVNVEEIRNVEIGYRSASQAQRAVPVVHSEALMLTQDENIVDVKIAVQYKVSSAKDYLFNVRDPDATLHQAIESALREVVGKNSMDFLLTEGRNQVVSLTKDLAQQYMDAYQSGLLVTSVNLQDAQPPAQVQAAFADVVKAREDKERFINEAEAYANDLIPRARGQAARMLEEASAYKDQVTAKSQGDADRFDALYTEYKEAPEVTRDRLYLDAMENVLSRSSKVMVTADGGNNLLYLPLDKLMNRQGGSVSGFSATEEALNVPSSTPSSSANKTDMRSMLRNRELR